MSESPSIKEKRAEQRKTALAMANSQRTKTAQLKQLIRTQQVDPVAVLNERDHAWWETANSIQVQDYLMAIKGFGHKTVAEILAEFPISGKMHIGRLSVARRRELIRMIELVQAP